MLLDSVEKSLTAVLDDAPNVELPITVAWEVLNDTNGQVTGIGSNSVDTDSDNEVTVIAAPTAKGGGGSSLSVSPRRLTFLSAVNISDAQRTITFTVNGRTVAEFILGVGDMCGYNVQRGFYIVTSTGTIKQTTTAIAENVPALVDSTGGTYAATLAAITIPTAITNNTGGTASATLSAMTVTEPADLAAVAAQLVIIQTAITTLATRQGENRAALNLLRNDVSSLVTHGASLLTSLEDASLMAEA